MLILTIRTDKATSEVGLYEANHRLVYKTWPAHHTLAENIHRTIKTLLTKVDKDWSDIQGIVCYKGPGSFTGLRIGLSLANALAYSLELPVVSEQGRWISSGIRRLQAGQTERIALPLYGAAVYTTLPRR